MMSGLEHVTENGMPSNDRYQLIDFGNGRKLESVAGRWIDRPSPAAEGISPGSPELWRKAVSRFEAGKRRWQHRPPWPDDLVVDTGLFQMPVRPTPFGHIGLFPEQQPNWQWLTQTPDTADRRPVANETKADDETSASRPPSDQWTWGLNLFGYTGASTLAMAVGGLAVTHVDAAKPNVRAAKAAAKLNGLAEHPIRLIVDDAVKFAAREVRRKRCYQTIVLDPPAYGHGPTGAAWRIERDLWPLLIECLRLLPETGYRLLVTGHSPQVDQHDVQEFLIEKITAHGLSPAHFEIGRSGLADAAGRKLDAGFFVRCTSARL